MNGGLVDVLAAEGSVSHAGCAFEWFLSLVTGMFGGLDWWIVVQDTMGLSTTSTLSGAALICRA
jgi:hypothetical protein